MITRNRCAFLIGYEYDRDVDGTDIAIHLGLWSIEWTSGQTGYDPTDPAR